jgi:hypothetical protein
LIKLGTLQANPGENWITHKTAREQIRKIAKENNLKLGIFAPKADNRKTLSIPLADGSGMISALRMPGADIVIVQTVKADELSAEVLAQIVADGNRKKTNE